MAEGEAILADPALPARRTAAWAAGGAPGAGAWALHGGRLGKVVSVNHYGQVAIRAANSGGPGVPTGPLGTPFRTPGALSGLTKTR